MNLPHTVTIVTPTITEDRTGDTVLDYGVTATRRTVQGWVQQTAASEEHSDRDKRSTSFTFHSDATPSMTALDRAEWDAKTFLVDGEPNHLDSPNGYHHTEARLLRIEG